MLDYRKAGLSVADAANYPCPSETAATCAKCQSLQMDLDAANAEVQRLSEIVGRREVIELNPVLVAAMEDSLVRQEGFNTTHVGE
jgi:hypothetical protein